MFSKKNKPETVTKEDLVVPDEITAGAHIATPMNWPPDTELDGEQIEVVGESFKQEALDQIGTLTKGGTFLIWLLPEPQNKYDKNAIRVMAGRHHIGYIAKTEAKRWSKRALPLWLEGKYLAGEAWGVNEDPVWQGRRGVRAKVWWPTDST